MTLSVVASFPVESLLVPSFFENFIDKKVAGIALNTLENLIHCLCLWIYFPYNHLFKAKASRVHAFSDDQVKLYDATRSAVAKVEHDWDHDYISIHNKVLYFILNINVRNTFSRETQTDYVVVRDDPLKRKNWYQIIEHVIPCEENPKPVERIWHLDANKVHRFGEREEVYLVEQPVRLLN